MSVHEMHSELCTCQYMRCTANCVHVSTWDAQRIM